MLDGPRLVLGDPLLTAGRQVAQSVQFLVKAAANETAVAADSGQSAISAASSLPRRSGHKSNSASIRHSKGLRGAVIFAFSLGKLPSVRPMKLKLRGLARPVVTRASSAPVVHAAQVVSQLAPQRVVLHQLLDGVQPLGDRFRIGQRFGQPVAQLPRAHGRDRAVQNSQQRPVARAGADRPRQFQTAACRFVDLQRAARR